MASATSSDGIEHRIFESLHSTNHVRGLTHNFYRYPARMSPDFAREVICNFSRPGEVVLDPFMGGGTTIVESVAQGRRAVGVDLNPLATFVATVKTTPMSLADIQSIERWAETVVLAWRDDELSDQVCEDARTTNLPESFLPILSQALQRVSLLPRPRQRRFARCALLRLGQWAIDCRRSTPEVSVLSTVFQSFVQEMIAGLNDFAIMARQNGVPKHKLTGQRTILLRSAVGLEESQTVKVQSRPRLVLTSPPYPAVHVLYHRWQVQGRRETPAPYWLIGAQDGRGASHYTLGSRSAHGLDYYFRTLVSIFASVRAVIHPDALVVQLLSFADPESQLPAYLTAMQEAGFREDMPSLADRADMWRTVPNRKWYNRIDAARSPARELLLFHRPDAQS